MKRYKQLDLEQRYKIATLKEEGWTQSMIANKLGVHKSTISRELRRNTPQRGSKAKRYEAKSAHEKAQKRERIKNKSYKFTLWMLVYIRDRLRKDRWSPEYISQRGRMEFVEFISAEIIYQYIWEAKHSKHRDLEEDKDLHKYLKNHGRRRKRSNTKQNRGLIPNRVPISKRPPIIESRKRYGDIEVDLMMGKSHKPGLIVLTDRATMESKLIKINTKNSKTIAKRIIAKLSPLQEHIKTLTFDNDLAFAKHELIAEKLEVSTYFTRPYTSQDKGTVENRIGQIRRWFPKGTDMEEVHANYIKSIERKLNNRPVRKFGYLTPNEKVELINHVALVS